MGSWRGEKERNIEGGNGEIEGKRRKEGRGERVESRAGLNIGREAV